MTAAAPIRVLIVDDDALVRAGLALMLGGGAGLQVVGEVADGSAVIAAIDRLAPDVVLMDIRMPRVDGISATTAVRARPEAPQVIVLTTFDADELVLSALRAGAAGFLVKDTPPADIVQAIERVAAGDAALSPRVTRQLIGLVRENDAADRRRAARQRLEHLSERERDVALAVGRGEANADIARSLYMSVATVKAHVSRILVKLDLTNRVQIALLAHDAGEL